MPHRAPRRSSAPLAPRRGMTLVEVLVVIAVIAALMAILFPALGIIRGQMKLLASQSNMRQIALYMNNYSGANRGYIPPSRFDYTGPFARTKVRSASPDGTTPNIGDLYKGSWADILWTTQGVGPIMPEFDPADPPPSPTWDYRYDSPDYYAYRPGESISKDVFRSAVELKNPIGNTVDDQLPTPFGPGAGMREKGQPGYFAANDFFDSTGGNWYTTAMIKRPAMSLYLVDSRAGETITMLPAAWIPDTPAGEVEFRYTGDMACILFLDGHVSVESKWANLNDLQTTRQIRVEKLNEN